MKWQAKLTLFLIFSPVSLSSFFKTFTIPVVYSIYIYIYLLILRIRRQPSSRYCHLNPFFTLLFFSLMGIKIGNNNNNYRTIKKKAISIHDLSEEGKRGKAMVTCNSIPGDLCEFIHIYIYICCEKVMKDNTPTL